MSETLTLLQAILQYAVENMTLNLKQNKTNQAKQRNKTYLRPLWSFKLRVQLYLYRSI